jgi:hypothetical protein
MLIPVEGVLPRLKDLEDGVQDRPYMSAVGSLL